VVNRLKSHFGILICILCDVFIVKVPQILKIVYASSTAGLSFASSTMELMGITGSLVYGFAMGFPFRFVYLLGVKCFQFPFYSPSLQKLLQAKLHQTI